MVNTDHAPGDAPEFEDFEPLTPIETTEAPPISNTLGIGVSPTGGFNEAEASRVTMFLQQTASGLLAKAHNDKTMVTRIKRTSKLICGSSNRPALALWLEQLTAYVEANEVDFDHPYFDQMERVGARLAALDAEMLESATEAG